MRWWLCPALVLFGACGEDAPEGAETLAVEQFAEAYHEARAEIVAHCLSTPIEAVRASFAARGAPDVDEVLASIDAGRVTYHPERAPACVEAMRANDCVSPAEGILGAECRAAFVGNRAIGDTCLSFADCAPGGDCDRRSFCAGTCVAAPTAEGEGEACGEERRCAGAFVCRDGRCGARPGDAEPCSSTVSCAEDFTCTSGRCARLPTEGPCLERLCARGFACASVPGGADRCTPIRQPGEPCTVVEAGPGECDLFAWCAVRGSGGVCTTLPSEGDTCGYLDQQAVNCLDGWCDTDGAWPALGTCRPWRRVGDACGGGQCGWGASCWQGQCSYACDAG